MSANIKASTDGTQAIIGVGGVDQMTVNNAGVVTANSFVGNTVTSNKFNVGTFEQIPEYPQAFKAQATRIESGSGSLENKTQASSSSYTTQTNPVDTTQLWTNAVVSPLGTNWVANKAVQTTIGSSANALIAGIFSETSTYAPNNGEAISVIGMTRALADRNPSGTGSGGDTWGGWFIATNNGWNSNCIGAELNATNQYANWMESPTPLNTDPSSLAFGCQIYPDWSTYHCTRAISIRPNATVGWSTGILVTGYVDHGLFIDSKESWRNPPLNTDPAQPVGITFGSNTAKKMAFWSAGATAWELNVETDYLLFRGDASNWFIGMNKTTKNLHLVNQKFRFDTDGRANIGGISNVGNLSGIGITIQGDNQHPLAITRSATALSTAPGANVAVLRWETGTNAGTLKLVAYAGTSTTGVTVVDNVGTGNS